jgi:hypothetical protein
MRAMLVGALMLCSPIAQAEIVGKVSGCAPSQAACNEVLRLALRPEPEVAQTESALFVGIFPLVNGQPAVGAGGYFNGKAWVLSQEPLPAFVGRIPTGPATVQIAGGVCGLVQKNKGPAGAYVLMAGYGRTNMGMAQSSGMDLDDLEREAQTADAETAAQLRALARDYKAAQQRLQVPGGKAAMAFTDMRSARRYWLMSNYTCGVQGQ